MQEFAMKKNLPFYFPVGNDWLKRKSGFLDEELKKKSCLKS
jgi:hypothetical protein